MDGVVQLLKGKFESNYWGDFQGGMVYLLSNKLPQLVRKVNTKINKIR